MELGVKDFALFIHLRLVPLFELFIPVFRLAADMILGVIAPKHEIIVISIPLLNHLQGLFKDERFLARVLLLILIFNLLFLFLRIKLA